MITLLDMDRGRGGGRWMTAAIWALIALTMVVNGRHADRSDVVSARAVYSPVVPHPLLGFDSQRR